MKGISRFYTHGKEQGSILITAEGHHSLNKHFSNIHVQGKQIVKYVNIVDTSMIP